MEGARRQRPRASNELSRTGHAAMVVGINGVRFLSENFVQPARAGWDTACSEPMFRNSNFMSRILIRVGLQRIDTIKITIPIVRPNTTQTITAVEPTLENGVSCMENWN